MIRAFFLKYSELLFWLTAIILMAISHPSLDTHFTICPLRLMGVTWCPGCGLGHSIAFLLHGDLRNSFHAHWLGVPALIIIVYRIFDLIRQRITESTLFVNKQTGSPL